MKSQVRHVFFLFLLSFASIGSAHADSSDSQVTVNETKGFLASMAEQYPGKIVYIDFWASWCVPCRKSFPFMNSLTEKYPDDLVVITVNEDSEDGLAEKFLAKYPANFEIVYDPDGKIATELDLPAMPSTYILDQQGKLVGKHHGFRKGDDVKLEAALVKLINENKSK